MAEFNFDISTDDVGEFSMADAQPMDVEPIGVSAALQSVLNPAGRQTENPVPMVQRTRVGLQRGGQTELARAERRRQFRRRFDGRDDVPDNKRALYHLYRSLSNLLEMGNHGMFVDLKAAPVPDTADFVDTIDTDASLLATATLAQRDAAFVDQLRRQISAVESVTVQRRSLEDLGETELLREWEQGTVGLSGTAEQVIDEAVANVRMVVQSGVKRKLTTETEPWILAMAKTRTTRTILAGIGRALYTQLGIADRRNTPSAHATENNLVLLEPLIERLASVEIRSIIVKNLLNIGRTTTTTTRVPHPML